MKRIAFITIGSFSNTNEMVAKQLRKQFPDYELDIIRVGRDILKPNKTTIAINALYLLKEYGLDILLGRKQARAFFFRTSYIGKRLKVLFECYYKSKPYIFTFQTQSIFDASAPDIPHFLYTDSTNRDDIIQPGYNKNDYFIEKHWKFEKSIYKNATLNFTMGKNVAETIVNYYDCNSSSVVCAYAGINIPLQTPKTSLNRYEKKNILFVGVEWERKGGPELISAFQEVRKFHPDATLTIVGCSPEISLENCTVVGRITPDQLPEYFENASIFCMPTTREPFGIVYLEAMHYRLPVIGTNIGSIPEMVKHGESGHLVNPYDIEGLFKALNDLLSNPEKCKRFGNNGYQNSKDVYTWDNFGEIIKTHIDAEIAKNSENARKQLQIS